MADTRKRWVEANCDHLASYKKDWYAAHEGEMKERSRVWYAEHRDYARGRNAQWKVEHKEEHRAIQAAWYREHREEVIANSRTRYEDKRDEILVANREYRKQNPAKVSAWSAARRARVANATLGTDTEAIIAIHKRAREDPNVTCYLCGRIPPIGERHVDHIVPLARGGKHVAENLAITCKRCNLKKCAKLQEEVAFA
jgi:5-methylcytosine-specific restriction endonuclease McrA